ncbi:MAG TPA: hypothetical protein VD790_00765 [Thermoleophilaceae bacterium]|nr:hypothetical protein [Thermoleophilaceae bacterium]
MSSRIFSLLALMAVLLASCGDDPEATDSAAIPSPADERRLERLEERKRTLERRLEREATTPAERAPAGDIMSAADASAFEAFADSLPGELGMTVGAAGDGGLEKLGTLQSGAAWSTIKVPIALRVTDDAGGPGRLDSQQRAWISAALTASDNAAAMELWNGLIATHGGVDGAAAAVTEVLRAAGDPNTVVSTQGRDGFSPYGQTEWSLEAQHAFMSSLAGGCLADRETTDYLLDLMGSVVPSQRWGLGEMPGQPRFKGGWGPGVDGAYLVRQIGVVNLDPGRGGIVATLAATADDGGFESGTQMLSDAARWLAARLPPRPPVAAPC